LQQLNKYLKHKENGNGNYSKTNRYREDD